MEQDLRQRLGQRQRLVVERYEVLRCVQFSPLQEGVKEEGGGLGLGRDGGEAPEDPAADVDLVDSLGEALEDEAASAGGGVETFDGLRLRSRH